MATRKSRIRIEEFYLSDYEVLERALELTGLSIGEVEYICGRFHEKHDLADRIMGKIIVYDTGEVEIRHHFLRHVLWRGEARECRRYEYEEHQDRC